MTTQTNRFTSDDERAGKRPALKGPVTIRVSWSDGRTTEHVCRALTYAYDVIGGEAHPFERWEMWA
jgi:hypothetical protein